MQSLDCRVTKYDNYFPIGTYNPSLSTNELD